MIALSLAVCCGALTGCSVKELIEDFNEFVQDNLLDDLAPEAPSSDYGDGGDDDDDNDDDDDDDNDNNDNDDDNNDNDNDDNDDDTALTPLIEIVDGGLPGNDGTSVARLPNGTAFVAAAKEGVLTIYTVLGNAMSREIIADNAASPAIAIDLAGRLHLAFRTTDEPTRVIHAVKEDGVWSPSVVGVDTGMVAPGLFLDEGDSPHVAFAQAGLGVAYAYRIDGTWQVEPVEGSLENAGRHFSLAIDAGGTPHLAYALDGIVKYATRTAKGWQATAFCAGGVESAHALRLGPSGRPQVAFRADDSLRLGVFDGIAWQYEQIDTAEQTGRFASLFVDAEGSRHVVYANPDRNELRYATDASGDWEALTVFTASTGEAGTWTALVRGEDAVLYAAFFATEGLGLATGDGGAWDVRLLDGGGTVGLYAAVAADEGGNPHAAYFDLTHRRLKYARKTGIDWSLEVVDQSADLGYYPSLAVDAAGFAHIAYYDRDHGDLRYTTNLLGPWTAIVVDAADDVGLNPALVLDAGDRVHITYFSAIGFGTLSYATNADGPWRTEIVDAAGDMGFYSSLAVDAAGAAHVAYQDRTAGAVLYATNESGLWAISSVDASGTAGAYVNLLLDEGGGAHLIYRAEATGALRYAHRGPDDTFWQRETIDTPGLFFSPSAIIDAGGVLHLIYYLADPPQVVYVWGASGAWTQATLDTGPVLSGVTSLAIDSAGWLHAAYAGSSSLKAALLQAERGLLTRSAQATLAPCKR